MAPVLVVDENGRLLGTINVNNIRSIPTALWSETPVIKVTQPIPDSTTVASDRPLSEAMQLLEQQKLSALTVIGDNGILVGILEKAAIIHLLQQKLQTNPA